MLTMKIIKQKDSAHTFHIFVKNMLMKMKIKMKIIMMSMSKPILLLNNLNMLMNYNSI
jgi:hypothetical protein